MKIVMMLVSLVVASSPAFAKNCSQEIYNLDDSNAQSEDRLQETYNVISTCAKSWPADGLASRLVFLCSHHVDEDGTTEIVDPSVVGRMTIASCIVDAYRYRESLGQAVKLGQ